MHILSLLKYFQILSLLIKNYVCTGIFKSVKSMLKKLSPIFCQKKSNIECTLSEQLITRRLIGLKFPFLVQNYTTNSNFCLKIQFRGR